MKRKELKKLAEKIAKNELIIQTSDDEKAIKRAENEILELSGHVTSLENMTAIDEIVQEILEKNI